MRNKVVFWKVVKDHFCGFSAFGTLLVKEDMEEIPEEIKEEKVYTVHFQGERTKHNFLQKSNLSKIVKEVEVIKTNYIINKEQVTTREYNVILDCGHEYTNSRFYIEKNEIIPSIGSSLQCAFC
jgi:hypothetical protein